METLKRLLEVLKKFGVVAWYWIKYSSENPEKVSRTLKSSIPLIISLGLLFKIDLSFLPEVVDTLLLMAAKATAIASGLSTLYFLAIKLRKTVLGTNAVFK
jgi:hypothetical protein